MMAGLDVNITGKVGNFPINAAFSAAPGITGVFGHSGSGKTSLLKMISGLVRPQSGRIVISGKPVFDSDAGINVPVHRRNAGFVFQDGRLFPHMTVARNLAYAQRHGGRSSAAGLEPVIELLGLAALLDRKPGTLSGGERQRVAIGRALLSDPQLLLMDEPLSSLDHARRQEVLPYLERMREETRVPIIYVSHEIDEVVRLADTLVVLSQGDVLASGPTAEVFGRIDLGPAVGRHEAGAIIDGQVEHGRDAYGLSTVVAGGERIELAAGDLSPGAKVRMRVRARDVSIAVNRPEGVSIRNCLAVRIASINRDETFAELVLTLGDQVLRARITVKSLEELGLREGMAVYALLKAISVERRALASNEAGSSG